MNYQNVSTNIYDRNLLRIALFVLLLFFCHMLKAEKLKPFLADTQGEVPAIIVCPGGSYSWHDRSTEGEDVAKWLQSQGISAFVLDYPVQGVISFVSHFRYIFRGHQHPDAINTLQSAITEIRSKAEEYHIDPHSVGVMGFSAGGHLAVSAAEFFTSALDRPDFVVSVYPVVTLRNNPWVHKRSRRALLGEYRKRTAMWQDSLSLELHARRDMPPVFLVNCVDDPVVHYHNSELLDSALTATGVPHEYHQYKTGGHGFGANPKKTSEECIAWKDAFFQWFNSQFRP